MLLLEKVRGGIESGCFVPGKLAGQRTLRAEDNIFLSEAHEFDNGRFDKLNTIRLIRGMISSTLVCNLQGQSIFVLISDSRLVLSTLHANQEEVSYDLHI